MVSVFGRSDHVTACQPTNLTRLSLAASSLTESNRNQHPGDLNNVNMKSGEDSLPACNPEESPNLVVACSKPDKKSGKTRKKAKAKKKNAEKEQAGNKTDGPESSTKVIHCRKPSMGSGKPRNGRKKQLQQDGKHSGSSSYQKQMIQKIINTEKQMSNKITGRGSLSGPTVSNNIPPGSTSSSLHSHQHHTTINNSPETTLTAVPKTLLDGLTNLAQDTPAQAAMFGNKRPPGRGKSFFLHFCMNAPSPPSSPKICLQANVLST